VNFVEEDYQKKDGWSVDDALKISLSETSENK
jgi:hypothetical protein